MSKRLEEIRERVGSGRYDRTDAALWTRYLLDRVEALEKGLWRAAGRAEAHARRIDELGIMQGCPSVATLLDEASRARALLTDSEDPEDG